MTASVHNNPAAHRYELQVGDDLAVAMYQVDGDVVAFTHTEVPEPLEGRGIGSRLVAGALADVRARGLKVEPVCPFVAAFIERHPDEQDLLAGP